MNQALPPLPPFLQPHPLLPQPLENKQMEVNGGKAPLMKFAFPKHTVPQTGVPLNIITKALPAHSILLDRSKPTVSKDGLLRPCYSVFLGGQGVQGNFTLFR